MSAADRARFYDYALGSTREAISWYNTLHIELGSVVDDRRRLSHQPESPASRISLNAKRGTRPETPV